jgi:phosphotransferase system IIA component
MDIHEMHIGLDLLTQRLNSNVFNRILPEEKDWFLNATIQRVDVEQLRPWG